LQVDKCGQCFCHSDAFGRVDRERRVWLPTEEFLVLRPLKLALDVNIKLLGKLHYILCSVLWVYGEVCCSLVRQSSTLKVQNYLKCGPLVGLLAKLSDSLDFDVRARLVISHIKIVRMGLLLLNFHVLKIFFFGVLTNPGQNVLVLLRFEF
jgi:hypothetical protein